MIKSMNKFLSAFLIVAMLLATTVTVAFADVTVTSSVANDGYLKVGENVELTFSEAITEENAKKITVTKVGGDGTNLVDTVAVDGAKVTLAFDDNLEYSASYKITVPAGVATSEYVSYFTTYNKYFRGINKVIVDENFNSMTADALPSYTIKADADDIGKFMLESTTSSGSVPTDTTIMSVKNTDNAYNKKGNSLYIKSTDCTKTSANNAYVILENYNSRISTSTTPKVGSVVISFKYRDALGNLNDMSLYTYNNSTKGVKNIAKIQNWQVTSAGVVKKVNTQTGWHDYTIEIAFEGDACKIVNATIDGEAVPGTQNLAYSSLAPTELRFLYLHIAHWTGNSTAEVYLDDIKIYEPTALTTTTVNATHQTATEHNTTYLTFTNPVDKTTLSKITVADENGNIITPVIKAGNNLKDVVLWMPNLSSNTKYTITVPNTVKDVFANSVTANSFEVTTEGAENPQLVIGDPEISGEIAGGETLTATVALTENTTSNNVDVTLAIALYNGIKLVDIKTVKETFAKNSTNEEITATLTIPNDIKGNYAARAFVLDNNLNKLANTASK